MDSAPIYHFPRYYDIVFARDVEHEVAFIRDLFVRQMGRPLASLVELACGPGYHARAFARQGATVFGLDLSPEMIEFARAETRSDPAAASMSWQVANILDFSLPALVDCAICMFDGLDSLLTNAELVQHLRAVGRNLAPGGLYVLQLTHPRQASYDHYGPFHYQAERDGMSIALNWGVNDPSYDLVTGVAQVEIETTITTAAGRDVSRAGHSERLILPQEMALMAQLSGALEVMDWYGDFDPRVRLDNTPRSQCMLGVLRKAA